MSLLQEAMTECVMLDKTTASDGYGGIITTWNEGAPFSAAIRFDSSMQARIAEQQGVKSLYTVVTNKNLTLQYHDVFKRLSDDKIFRVTSDGKDNKTPESANLNIREVNAEEWRLS